MSEEQTVTNQAHGEVALVGLNRPDKRNCFNPTVMKQLREVVLSVPAKKPNAASSSGMATISAPVSTCAGPRRIGRPGAHSGCRSRSIATLF